VKESTPELALRSLVEWSRNQPRWIRHALGGLLTGEASVLEDLDALRELCIEPEARPELEELAEGEMLPHEPGGAVSLLRVHRLRNVNALREDGSLAFEPVGVNVVFGENGTGKSGYARILLSAGRARSVPAKVLPDVFGDRQEPSAAIEIEVAGVARTALWVAGESTDPVLKKVSVFDSQCAQVQVAGTNEIAYVPWALSLLQELASIAGRLREILEREKKGVEDASELDSIIDEMTEGTSVYDTLVGLDDGPQLEKLERLAQLSDEEVRRKAALEHDLSGDPEDTAKRLRLLANRFDALARSAAEARSMLSGSAWETLVKLRDEARANREAARVAASTAFGSEPLSGVGTETWKRLWEAARSFSEEHAYPGEPFPNAADSKCVLCLQPLGTEAHERLTRFEVHVRSDTEAKAMEAEDKYDQAIRKVELLRYQSSRTIGTEVWTELGEHADEVRRHCVTARLRRRAALRGTFDDRVPDLPDDCGPRLVAASRSLKERALAVELAADSDERAALEKERGELHDRDLLRNRIAAVRREAGRITSLKKLSAALQSTDTARITRESSSLATKLVTPGLQQAFERELQALGVRAMRVELTRAGGQYGVQRYKITLDGVDGASPAEVLSEGERTCVGLAGFLSELATASHQSAIVLDDPVTSLDHRWRRAVARRLIEEGSRRQVNIFTHDAVFLLELLEQAEDDGIALRLSHVARSGGKPGTVFDGAPWVAMKVKDRIGFLKNRLQQAEATLRRGDDQTYDLLAGDLYGSLRETWERAVEEVLLNSAVVRFGREVQTKRLKRVTDITEEDIGAVDDGMTKCSRFMRGHDQPSAVTEDMPRPDEIRSDIDALDAWVGNLRKTRGR